MQDIQIWHNQSCSKSRDAMDLLNEKNIKVEVINYLENPPSIEELKDILKKLNIKAKELLRDNEELYVTLNLKDEDNEEKIIEIMVQNPILIQRPIIIKGQKAVIARPIENLKELLNEF
ncbi:arsenate reductase (glutaredoxin) [Aliarcobacter lanthieri]|uniref:arsenate reductase (glutaredoxin) n=1 Tax=Aliarcobacter lanthieri TaxID=1355374 RepID=UPI00047ACC26|nr:arsenate reductase (glutaredoxin) [Aliarcobacter lanthieri]QKF58930.1 arsenate reductase (ArsC) family protein [Aliarcobacter lanthieri]